MDSSQEEYAINDVIDMRRMSSRREGPNIAFETVYRTSTGPEGGALKHKNHPNRGERSENYCEFFNTRSRKMFIEIVIFAIR